MNVAAHRGIAIVSGIMFWYPLAGVTYQFLHYLIGLRRLGFKVYYIEDSGRWVYDPIKRQMTRDARANVERVLPVLQAHGLGDAWAFREAYAGGQSYGMPYEKVQALYRDADVLLNVTGAQELREEHLQIERRIYIETDPFGTQVKLQQGDAPLRALVDAHDTWFSFGENVGQPDCLAPVDRTWLPTRQPVLLDFWKPQPTAASTGRYRTVCTWHNDGKDVSHRGELYHWTKDREFLRLLDLPARRPELQFELASDADVLSREKLQARGFIMSDSLEISSELEPYRAFIDHSRAELTVARDQYVRPNTGWFSDRSACYLAAARPVITQHTGFEKFIPVGRGLFAFNTVDDIAAAIDTIESDYAAHSKAALEIAHEYFAAEKVLEHLLARAGL